MNINIKYSYVFLCFIATTAGLFAQAQAQTQADAENIITAVSSQGLKRTKPYILQSYLQKFIGLDARTIDKNDVYAVIQGTGTLELLSIEIVNNETGGGKKLIVVVREKWSILPMPIVSVSSSSWMVGAALMDTNAFGIKDNLMLMAMYGPGNWMGNVMWVHQASSVGKFGWNIMGRFSLQENEITDQRDEEVLRRYNSMTIKPAIGLSYKLSESITPSIGISYTYISLRDCENPVNAPESGVQALSISPGISVRQSTWDGYFLNEKNLSAKYEYTFGVDDLSVHVLQVSGVFNHSMIPGFRIIAKSGMVFATKSATPFFDSPQMSAAVNILPAHYYANNIGGISLGIEKYLFKFAFGTVSLSGAYQVVHSNVDLFDENQLDLGGIALLQMYFSKLAIPAMGLGAAYNADKRFWQFAFNIGMQF